MKTGMPRLAGGDAASRDVRLCRGQGGVIGT